MARPEHPNKEIEAAVKHAISKGWRFKGSKGHAWGRLFCPAKVRGGCQISVWSTPKSPFDHARQIRRRVDKCPHAFANQ